MQNKNKRISKSLKRYHKRKQTKKDIKKVLWITALFALAGFYSNHFNPVYGSINDFTQNNVLPQNQDIELKTDKDKIIHYSKIECQKRGLGEQCALDIQAIAYTESRFNCKAIGDKGYSKGCMQIHQGYHPHITTEQAEDPQFAVSWTIDRMISKGYPEYRSIAIRSHNGSPTNPKTYNYLMAVNNYINN
jgi:hypothetical protein